MDNLHWFKFSPADWMMGRIQRQPAQVQVDFLRVCCQYWKNECKYSIEDAKLDAMNSYDELVKYKIIKENGDNIVIDFLDEQLGEIETKRTQASEAGKRSAEVRKRQAELNARSTTVKQPINEQSTESNREDKSRLEKIREEEEKEEDLLTPTPFDEFWTDFDEFWKLYDKNIGQYKCQRIWSEIDAPEYPKILEHVAKYVKATPNKKYRKNPEKYLADRSWMDEIEDYGGEKPKEEKVYPEGYDKDHDPKDGFWEKRWDGTMGWTKYANL